ncbi:carcinoembryonic antigen-related cell adhesion molecule 2 [Xenopus laevis]|uniref:Carcinoembryonic antigen-related cell adhesion molecule 2 n=2 Tax=Xenopus laevis TaxID=8355 RepID=A0A1L8F4L9_XENLA|nr:carcinoembryonic antigen-related cell adhesion molecule 2 [Xenopus laevis]OCT66508.1 hypothetical protein XELAEV_18042758mg [Xenopus laevis]
MHPLIPQLSLLLISLPLQGTDDPVTKVNKPVNGTVTFRHGFELGAKTLCTVRMSSQGEWREVAEYRDSHFNVTNEQFETRTVFMKSTFKIQSLTVNDSGVYDISCWNAPKPNKMWSVFNLTVYEPVQQPDIKRECQCEYNDCNCTLHCLDPTNSSSIHWTILRDSKPVKNLSQSTIRALLGDTFENIEYVCVLQNPADQKNSSIGFRQLCSASRYSDFLCWCWKYWKRCIYLTVIVLGIILIVALAKKVKEACLKMSRKVCGYFSSWRTEVANEWEQD